MVKEIYKRKKGIYFFFTGAASSPTFFIMDVPTSRHTALPTEGNVLHPESIIRQPWSVLRVCTYPCLNARFWWHLQIGLREPFTSEGFIKFKKRTQNKQTSKNLVASSLIFSWKMLQVKWLSDKNRSWLKEVLRVRSRCGALALHGHHNESCKRVFPTGESQKIAQIYCIHVAL